jgi:glycosyltransferase involved in cell wall biosynthesis
MGHIDVSSMVGKAMRTKKLLFFVTEDWYFCSHRLPLALAAKNAGYDVSVVTRVGSHGEQIKSAGLKLYPLNLSRRGMNPFREISVIKQIVAIFKTEKPDIVHHVALKPVLYGSIAAYFAKIQVTVNALAGLGFLFSSNSFKARITRPIVLQVFRLLLNCKGGHVILQNPDDRKLLCENNVITPDRITLIRGSGVNLDEFVLQPEPVGTPLIVLASRLLWDKGVGEFVSAARQLKSQNVDARFVLVGEGDVENPTAVLDKQLKEWHEEGFVEWWGKKNNMPRILAESHIICLPSAYGEGVPKVLIEAAACGRPIVTTDAPGCREIVKDRENGILVPLRNAKAVAKALKKLIDSPDLRKKMGENGRKIVEKEFSLDKVNQATLLLYKKLST